MGLEGLKKSDEQMTVELKGYGTSNSNVDCCDCHYACGSGTTM